MSQLSKESMQEVQVILQDMVAHLLIHKPEEPVPHIIQFLQDTKKEGAAPLSKEERIELDHLRSELQRLKEKKAQIKQKQGEESGSDSEEVAKKKKGGDGSSTDSENEEYMDTVNDNLSPINHKDKLQMAQKSRTSVSAEVFGKYHVKEAFKPKVINKSAEIK